MALRDKAQGALARTGFRLTRVPTAGNLGRTHPDFDQAFATVYARCRLLTLTSPERMYALWSGVRHVCRQSVPGDMVECGVWRGGSPMVIALTLAQEDDFDRRIWLYDTFEGMSEPTGRDVAVDGLDAVAEWDTLKGTPGAPGIPYATLDDVKTNMASTGVAPERVSYVQGPVEETIPGTVPRAIALLRLDTDWYESTRHELEHLWDRLSPGGVLVIDDYGHWAGARDAVDEFFAGRDDAPLLARVDYTGRVAVKR